MVELKKKSDGTKYHVRVTQSDGGIIEYCTVIAATVRRDVSQGTEATVVELGQDSWWEKIYKDGKLVESEEYEYHIGEEEKEEEM